ncbi:DUF6349 family protein [Microbacterium lacticum]
MGTNRHGEQQLAFDFDELLREDARAQLHDWTGAPLRFTTAYYPPTLLDEAFEHWTLLNGRFASHARSHMWHRPLWNSDATTFGEHRGALFDVDLSPGPDAEGPGGLLAQMVCEPCNWHTIASSEDSAVEQWHDHAVPEWRALPVIPAAVRVRDGATLTKLAAAWIRERYPQHLQVPGAPIITERQPFATRHVPRYSPWGGYDLSATALDHPQTPSAEAAVRGPLPSATLRPRSAGRAPGRGRGLTG